MKIILKDLFCMEWEFNREIVLDEDQSYSVIAYIGPNDLEIAEGFEVIICNCEFVQKQIVNHSFFNGLWHVVVNDPKKDNIESYFTKVIEEFSEASWNDCAKKLRLIGKSEFEEYH